MVNLYVILRILINLYLKKIIKLSEFHILFNLLRNNTQTFKVLYDVLKKNNTDIISNMIWEKDY